jgi:ankyrin repeat protein
MIQLKAPNTRKLSMIIFVSAVVISSLAGARADAQGSDLGYAAEQDDLPLVKELIAKGPNSYYKDAALVAATCGNGSLAMVRLLLAANANPNVNGRPPLICALQHGSPLNGNAEELELLLAAGANPNLSDVEGWTPLMVAVDKESGDSGVESGGDLLNLRVLLAAKADVNSRTERGAFLPHAKRQNGLLYLCNGCNALMIAVADGHLEAVRLLLAAGANPNAQDDGGPTPLDEAAISGNVEVARLLLDSGAKINHGSRDLKLATENHNPQMAEFLRSRGAKLSFLDSDEGTRLTQTLIHLAPFTLIGIFACLSAFFFWQEWRKGKFRMPANFPFKPLHIAMWIALMLITHPWTFKGAASPFLATVVIGAMAAIILKQFVK